MANLSTHDLASVLASAVTYSQRVEQLCLDLDVTRLRAEAGESPTAADVAGLVASLQEGQRRSAGHALLVATLLVKNNEARPAAVGLRSRVRGWIQNFKSRKS